MKKLFSIFSLLSLMTVVFYACNEDIELVGDYKKTAVVYGLLDKNDTIHYIKITRAFIGNGSNANEIALIPDSNYFASVTGTVKEYGGGIVGRTFVLRDTIVENKDVNGAFYAPQQKLYYFKTKSSEPLLGDKEYQLDLNINNGAFEISGRTELVSGVSNNNISGVTQPFRFIDNQGEFLTTNVILTSVGNSRIVNTTVNIEFTEWEGTTPTIRNAKWTLGEFECEPNTSMSFTAQGATFYNVIANNCSNNSAVTKRTINSMTTVVTAGAEELAYYMQVNEPSSSLAQTKPTFTNLTATNGQSVVGIFSSRQTLSIYKPFIDPNNQQVRCINTNSTEYLCVGAIMQGYLFCSDHPVDIAQNKPWICN